MRPVVVAALLLLPAIANAQTRAKPAPAKEYPRGQKLLDDYFRAQVAEIAGGCLSDLTTRDEWEKRRPELRRQFFDMMGLWPNPPRTDLRATVTGTVTGDGFVVEKLHYQSLPGLYVTANLYRPANPPAGAKLPAVLYVCGHGNAVVGGVSYGSKVPYQYHPAWFAANGYACLIVDTLQLGEIEGIHHGTYRYGMWWWQGRGYTPAGVELWNAIRGLDYLQSSPDVDPERLGVTGRSGGGATSWWVAAADDRVKAAVPVAGIADLQAHVYDGANARFPKGVVNGHCDCMFPVNTYRWDFAQVAALVAPRPLLLGNSDADTIFPVPGYRRLADKARKVYALYGAADRFDLLETKGPHVDTPELVNGINAWMGRWLKGEKSPPPAVTKLEKPFAPQQLRVLAKKPEDERNTTAHEWFVRPARAELPESPKVAAEWWAGERAALTAALRDRVFRGWPAAAPQLRPVVAADVVRDGARLRAVDFTSEAGVELRLFVLTAADAGPPKEVVLSVLDHAGWDKWCRDLGPAFADSLLLDDPVKRDDAQFAQNLAAMRRGGLAFAAVCPRGVGPTKWAEPGSVADTQTRRRFPLLGQTLDGQRVWDVRRAVAAVGALDDLKPLPLTLHAEKGMAVPAVYAAVFEPAVAALDLWHPPATHRDGPPLLNAERVLDFPRAVALTAPRRVTLHLAADADRAGWDGLVRLARAAGDAGPRPTLKVVGE